MTTTNSLQNELLNQSTEEVKSSIGRIVSSYRHVWDIYTELLQNCADAVVERFGQPGVINGIVELSVESSARKITISDNGIGIDESNLAKILATGKSLKRESGNGRYGFMGFGFTFVAFQTSYLRIESVFAGKRSSRTYKDLYKYAFGSSLLPNSEEEIQGTAASATQDDLGTTITAIFPANFPLDATENSLRDAFALTLAPHQFIAMLRTKTIIGSLDVTFDGGPMFQFKLNLDGIAHSVPTGYLTTREVTKTALGQEMQFYERSAYEALILATEPIPLASQDVARRALLLDEKVPFLSIGQRNPIVARVLVSATSKSYINQYNESLLVPNGIEHFKIEHGIWLSLAGMPTGVCIDAFDEHSDLLPYTVIVDISDSTVKLELDAGRKGITQYRAKQIKEAVLTLLRTHNFIKYRRYIVGGAGGRVTNPLYDAKAELRRILGQKSQRAYPLFQTHFPPFEEQEVVSLFTELCTRDLLKGYHQKVLSSYQVYDGLFDYRLERSPETLRDVSINPLGIYSAVFDRNSSILCKEIFVEFKRDLNGLYRDIMQLRKNINDIDVLICWDVDFASAGDLLRNKGDVLQLVDATTNVFYGVTHTLMTSGRTHPLPVIELQKVVALLFGSMAPVVGDVAPVSTA